MLSLNKKMISSCIILTSCQTSLSAIPSDVTEVRDQPMVDIYSTRELEEIIVTAQKRKQSIQDAPIAISALTEDQLKSLGVHSIDGLIDSIIPSLHVSPSGNSPSAPLISIRGDGPFDVAQPTRQGSVAVYIDEVYLGRAQGLNMELADLKRIEVLRGPQGTLFGRNSTSGAINLVSNKPTSEFGFTQTTGLGSYGAFDNTSRLNLGDFSGVNAKLDYVHSERDGWVKNKANGQANFNEYDKDGVKLSIHWQATDDFTLDYTYDLSNIKTTQVYYQLYEDNVGVIGRERNRSTSTRTPLDLEPIEVDSDGHSIISHWLISDALSFKSITAYRELFEDGYSNYGGTLYSNGLNINEDIEQEQVSQELQLIGQIENIGIDWVTGIFYFEEKSDFDLQFIQQILPTPAASPVTTVVSDSNSMAFYGQGTLEVYKNWDLTFGARYTDDKQTAIRSGIESEKINSDNTDLLAALRYKWDDNISTYLKWSTAYKAGGYNARSVSFKPFDEEDVTTFELGLKSQFLDNRLRINTAIFKSITENKQFDFNDPNNVFLVETLNAEKDVEISGVELDIKTLLARDIIVGLHYTYLDGDMPEQQHPTIPDTTQRFELVYTPKHAGSVTLDYILPRTSLFECSFHMDITSTGRFAHSTAPTTSQDSYSLLNSKITFNKINLSNTGVLSLSLWGKNLTNEEYATLRFPIDTPSVTIQSYGTPRTVGIEASYRY